MGFNAGGTNVSGVQSIEPGVLKTVNVTATDYATGSYKTLNIGTVPAGKKWIVKGFFAGGASWVGTVAAISVGTTVDTVYFRPIQEQTTFNPCLFFFPQPYTLKAGDSITCKYNLSAFTSGTFNITASYQEVDA